MRKFITTLILTSLFLGLASACGAQDNTPIPEPTPTIEVMPTPTMAPERAVLIADTATDAWTLEQATAALQELTYNSGLEFEIRSTINASEITPDIKVLVFLQHPENLGSLSNAAPGTQFIVISDQEWTPSANVNIIRSDTNHQVFMAGYAAVMLSDNFRGAGLLTVEEPELKTAFVIGAKFFCGLCNSLVYPLNVYPVYKELPSTSQPSEWLAGFNELALSTIQYLYIPPQAYSADLFNALAPSGIRLVGIISPPAEAAPMWAGTLKSDGFVPLRTIWDDVLQGIGGKTVYASLQLTDTQTGFIGEGKQKLINSVIEEMQAGRIYTQDPMVD